MFAPYLGASALTWVAYYLVVNFRIQPKIGRLLEDFYASAGNTRRATSRSEQIGNRIAERLPFSLDAWEEHLKWAQRGGYFKGWGIGRLVFMATLYAGVGVCVLLAHPSPASLLIPLGAAAYPFISVHANASEGRSMSGVETYYLNNATDEAANRLAKRENHSSQARVSKVDHIISTMLQNVDTEESREVATKVQGALTSTLARFGKQGKVHDRGVRSALFYVLVGAKCPAILVETSFISNPREEKLLRDRAYQSSIAGAITNGVGSYLHERDRKMVSL